MGDRTTSNLWWQNNQYTRMYLKETTSTSMSKKITHWLSNMPRMMRSQRLLTKTIMMMRKEANNLQEKLQSRTYNSGEGSQSTLWTLKATSPDITPPPMLNSMNLMSSPLQKKVIGQSETPSCSQPSIICPQLDLRTQTKVSRTTPNNRYRTLK